MSKKLRNKFIFFLLCLILQFYSTSHSADNIDNFKIQNWIENIPILSSLIENKIDVVGTNNLQHITYCHLNPILASQSSKQQHIFTVI